MDVEVIEPPAAEAHLDVVSLQAMKTHLGITHTLRDDAIKEAVRDAVAFFDFEGGVLNRSVLKRTLRAYLDEFPTCARPLNLPYAPVRAVTSIIYRDRAAEQITVDPTHYVSMAGEGFGDIVTLQSTGWPLMPRYGRGLAVEYEAGYDEAPALLKRGVKLLAAHYLRNPDATLSANRDTRANHAIQFGLDQIITSFRIPLRFGAPLP